MARQPPQRPHQIFQRNRTILHSGPPQVKALVNHFSRVNPENPEDPVDREATPGAAKDPQALMETRMIPEGAEETKISAN